MAKKTCFVVMGFGKKTDYRNSVEVDLDIIYRQVIQEVFISDFQDYELIRADDLRGSNVIDIEMYTLLLQADLVIADISLMNENALYELGIRHALRPYSTIIMMRDNDRYSIPFDLNHNRILQYADFGKRLSREEADGIKRKLKDYIRDSAEQDNPKTDSPFYTYLSHVEPPLLRTEEGYRHVVETAKQRDVTVSDLIQKAEDYKKESDFAKARVIWEKLHRMVPTNDYVAQQYALSYYKSKEPNETLALEEALNIIKRLKPEKSLDIETLGITGAIYKNLYFLNRNFDYLDMAIQMYHKGFVIQNDYYNGDNYANCLLFKSQNEALDEEQRHFLCYHSKEIYKQVFALSQKQIDPTEEDHWLYASLSIASYATGRLEEHKKYHACFIESALPNWEKETYLSHLNMVRDCLALDI